MSNKEERLTGIVKQQDKLTHIKGGYNPPPVIHVSKPKPTPAPPPKNMDVLPVTWVKCYYNS